MILMAQAVPSAHAIPCVDALPPGWSIGGISVQAADARFWLDSDRYGSHAVQIGLRSADRCPGAQAPSSTSPPLAGNRSIEAAAPSGRPTRTLVSGTACITYEFVPGIEGATMAVVDSALEFQPRTELSPRFTVARGSRPAGPGRHDAPMTRHDLTGWTLAGKALNAKTQRHLVPHLHYRTRGELSAPARVSPGVPRDPHGRGRTGRAAIPAPLADTHDQLDGCAQPISSHDDDRRFTWRSFGAHSRRSGAVTDRMIRARRGLRAAPRTRASRSRQPRHGGRGLGPRRVPAFGTPVVTKATWISARRNGHSGAAADDALVGVITLFGRAG